MIFYQSYEYTICTPEGARTSEGIDVQAASLPGLVRSLIGQFDLPENAEVIIREPFIKNVCAFAIDHENGSRYIFCIGKMQVHDIDVSEFGDVHVSVVTSPES